MRVFALVFVGYLAGALMSMTVYGQTAVAGFFPAAGVTVAAMLLTRRTLWPPIVAAIVLGEFVVDLTHGMTVSSAGIFALGNVIEPVVGASLVLAWVGGTPDLRRRSDLIRFVAGACIAGPLAGGLVGGSLNAVVNGVPWLPAVLQWFAGDAIGVLAVGAPILLWPRQSDVIKSKPVESAVTLVAAGLLSLIGFSIEAPPAILTLPVLALAAVRLNVIGAALVGTVVATVGNIVTTAGGGLISDMGISDSSKLAVTQVFIAVLLLVGLLIAQEVTQRTTAVRERDVERGERLRLESLSALAQQLSAALTPEEVVDALQHRMVSESDVRILTLGLLNGDKTRLEWVGTDRWPEQLRRELGGGLDLASRSVVTDVARSGEPVLIPTAENYRQRYAGTTHWQALTASESIVGWPLALGGNVIGALLLAWAEPQPLDPEQLAYVSAAAAMAGQALVRAQVYADEHARAVVLHAAVQPAGGVTTVGMDCCVFYEPSDVVHGLGGDWYDVLPLGKGRTYLSVGDIMGHGLAAVEDMAQLRTAGRAFANQGLSPARVLAELDSFTERVTHGDFATVVVAIYDHQTGILSYSSAGHPPALLRSGSTGEVVQLSDANGPVLGPVEEPGYQDGIVRIEPGDVLVMYSDGLVEHAGSDVRSGIRRVEQLLARRPAAAPLDCRAIAEELAPPPCPDDVCLLMVRFLDRDPAAV